MGSIFVSHYYQGTMYFFQIFLLISLSSKQRLRLLSFFFFLPDGREVYCEGTLRFCYAKTKFHSLRFFSDHTLSRSLVFNDNKCLHYLQVINYSLSLQKLKALPIGMRINQWFSLSWLREITAERGGQLRATKAG